MSLPVQSDKPGFWGDLSQIDLDRASSFRVKPTPKKTAISQRPVSPVPMPIQEVEAWPGDVDPTKKV